MVKKIDNNKKECFRCEECNLLYLDEKKAKECEGWCEKYKSCNLQIIESSIPDNNNGKKDNT